MRKTLQPFAVALAVATLFAACKKEAKDVVAEDAVPESVKAQIRSLGFGAEDAKKTDGGYLVEGDLLLTTEQLTAGLPQSPNMVIANEEQYRTFNTVNTGNHPVIKVALNNSSAQHDAAFSAALDESIRRYNAESLTVQFQRVSTGADITVVAYYEVSNTLGSAGFPNAAGDPYNQVKMNTYWYKTTTEATNVNYIGTIMTHEIGHCIGFRHTDYMNRAYSCGGRKQNEGQANYGVGAVYIPGTPSGPDANSFMLACVGDLVNRPFTANDKVALNYVY